MPQYPIYNHGIRTDNRVALTFDDGPNPPQTEQVLEILDAHSIRATFFLLGRWVDRFPRTVERIIAGSHLIGNHGYAGQGRIGDYDAAEAAIAHLTGRPSTYLRPHTMNYAAYFQSVISQLPESHLIGVEVDSRDWRTTSDSAPLFSPDEIANNVLDHPALGPGSIILFHDGSEWDDAALRLRRPLHMIAALSRIITGLKERGLTPVRVDEMELVEPIEWKGMYPE